MALETVISSNAPTSRPRRLTIRTSTSRARSTSESSRSSSMSPRPSVTSLSDVPGKATDHATGYEAQSRDYFLGGSDAQAAVKKSVEGVGAEEEKVRTPLVEPLRLAEEEKPRWKGRKMSVVIKPGRH